MNGLIFRGNTRVLPFHFDWRGGGLYGEHPPRFLLVSPATPYGGGVPILNGETSSSN